MASRRDSKANDDTKPPADDGPIPVSSEYSSLPEVHAPPPPPPTNAFNPYDTTPHPHHHANPYGLATTPWGPQHGTPAISPLTPSLAGTPYPPPPPHPFSPFPPPAGPYDAPPPRYDAAYDGPLPGGAGPGYGYVPPPGGASGGLGPLAAARRRKQLRNRLIAAAAVAVVLVVVGLGVAFGMGWIHLKNRSGSNSSSKRSWDGGDMEGLVVRGGVLAVRRVGMARAVAAGEVG